MTTRSELLADLDPWLARDDISVNVDTSTFLRMAQAVLNRRIRVRAQETTVELSCTSRTTALPSDYLSARSVTLQSTIGRVLDQLTPERIRESAIWNNQGGSAADNTPAAYAIEGTNLILAPAPTVSAPVIIDLVYFAKFADLTASNDTNWLLTNAYDIYLYACLHVVGVYLQDVEMAQGYESLMDKGIIELERSERRARFGGSALVSTGSPRS